MLAIACAVGRTDRSLVLAGQYHHLWAGLGDRRRQILPIAHGQLNDFGMVFAERIRRVAQGDESKVAVQSEIIGQ